MDCGALVIFRLKIIRKDHDAVPGGSWVATMIYTIKGESKNTFIPTTSKEASGRELQSSAIAPSKGYYARRLQKDAAPSIQDSNTQKLHVAGSEGAPMWRPCSYLDHYRTPELKSLYIHIYT